MKRLNKRGVSLAELLAVVVIMGIIAAIAIPLVGNVIETAKRKAFLGDLVSVSEAARAYCISEGNIDDPNSICKVYKDATDVQPNGMMDEAKILGIKVSTMPNFEKYLSKPLDKIAKEVYVVTNGNVYYVKTISEKGKYTTTTPECASASLNDNTLVPSTEEWFINPSYSEALDLIGIAKGEK